ncbi:guanylate kinase [Coccinella septempunctata]|uniref:guanylate kinase n=1 Tax=Coccinella septempunctata TaxID=41139 RepID=UPI001D077797|nr:guanylate kinase [Coccinella septempunctata]XP_044754877.1 guanylate kinase [Coccinella septempunctata]XP_044754878.1 guanylate kinase [Coccinella septempunctata]
MAAEAVAISKLRPLVLCGPSGSGKSTLLQRILKEYPDRFSLSVSHTTRKPRPGEVDGVHYHFTDSSNMEKAISEGKFIESAKFSGNLYGTSKESVRKIAEEGKICILDVEVNGVRQIKQTDLNPWYVFIKPPSLAVLEERLRARKTETEDSLRKRLDTAHIEMEYGMQPGNFDKIIVNDVLEVAYEELKQFISENVLISGH